MDVTWRGCRVECERHSAFGIRFRAPGTPYAAPLLHLLTCSLSTLLRSTPHLRDLPSPARRPVPAAPPPHTVQRAHHRLAILGRDAPRRPRARVPAARGAAGPHLALPQTLQRQRQDEPDGGGEVGGEEVVSCVLVRRPRSAGRWSCPRLRLLRGQGCTHGVQPFMMSAAQDPALASEHARAGARTGHQPRRCP